jgi:hypothetical protein
MVAAEEWEALLRENSVMRLLGIVSLRAFDGCDSVVGVNAFVRTAFVRLLHQPVPGYDPFRDLESTNLSYGTNGLREPLYTLASVGYTTSQRRSELKSPPSKIWCEVLRRLQVAHMTLLRCLSSPYPPVTKDASFVPPPMPWTALAVEWPRRLPHNNEHRAWCSETRVWLWEIGMVEEAAVLLGDPRDYLLRLISVRSGELNHMAEFHAHSVWPRAMQQRLPALVDECARLLPVIALPELVAEYVFGEAVRDWLPRCAV